VNNSLSVGLEKYGNETEAKIPEPKLSTGEINWPLFCLLKPEAGSDATSQKTTAIAYA